LKTPVKFRRKYFKLVLKGSVEADDRCSHNLIWVDGILLSVRRSLASASRLVLRQLVWLDDDFSVDRRWLDLPGDDPDEGSVGLLDQTT